MTKVSKILAQNRKARHEYFIEATLEAGICLQGSEVKALRAGRGSIGEAYATEEKGEIFLYNAFIPEYKQASYMNHEPRRTRKLLLHRREIRKLIGQIQRRGKTLILLSLYLNTKGKVKAELGLAQGKKNIDKRETLKERDWKLDKARLLKTQVR